MKFKWVLLSVLTTLSASLPAQKLTNIEVQPQGVYATIRVESQNRTMKQLYDPKTRSATVDTIFQNFSSYNPPVMYIFSQALFYGGEKDAAVQWYFYAHLQARFDAEICADESAKQGILILEENMRPVLGEYIQKHPTESDKSASMALVLFEKIEPSYDRRWINLHGLGSFAGVFGDSVPANPKLSVDAILWPSIKSNIIKEFKSKHHL